MTTTNCRHHANLYFTPLFGKQEAGGDVVGIIVTEEGWNETRSAAPLYPIAAHLRPAAARYGPDNIAKGRAAMCRWGYCP